MSNIINFDSKVTLEQAVSLIVSARNCRFNLKGEPGIGKTSIVKSLQKATGMDAAIMSMPDMDLGDIAMPVIDHESRTTRYYPNARFKLHLGKPVIICLDEWSKAPDPVKNMTHPLLDTFRPRLGDVPVPEGSIIFLTGNLESDGVGDSMKAHTRMRVVNTHVAKPDNEAWKKWASGNDIHPVVIAWADRYPHAFASYTDDGQKGNEFIFDPQRQREGYVTPRTLELASNIIHAREGFDTHSLGVALAGAVGRPAAESLKSFIRHQDSLPPWTEILKTPTTAKLPKDPGAMAVMVFSSIERITKGTELDAVLQYLSRTDEEWQSVFCLGMAHHEAKSSFTFTNKTFANWVEKNQDLL
jgi:hypothetical protein